MICDERRENEGNNYKIVNSNLYGSCTIVKRVDTFFKEKYLRTVA